MTDAQLLFSEMVTVVQVLTITYFSFFVLMAFICTAMTVLVYLKRERFASASKTNRTLFFAIYLALNVSNIPFGFYVSNAILELRDFYARQPGALFPDFPLATLASLGVQTGIVGHLLFCAFWLLAWMHVENAPTKKA